MHTLNSLVVYNIPHSATKCRHCIVLQCTKTVHVHEVSTLYSIVVCRIVPQNAHTTVPPVHAAPKIGNRAQSVAARLLENSLQYMVKCGVEHSA